ncbi:MAG: lipoprotein [Burkholderiaceae bacterium]
MPSDQPAVGSPPVCYPARAGRVRVGAIVLTILFLVGACGQRGPLYLPTPEQQRAQAERDKVRAQRKAAEAAKADSTPAPGTP